MSLFQCDKCGCLENTALTGGAYGLSCIKDRPDVVASYLEVLGHPGWYPLGWYCSACNPLWFTDDGDCGVGPRPKDHNEKGFGRAKNSGEWHSNFERRFLTKGMFAMNEDGNLGHVDTLDTDMRNHVLLCEDDRLAPPRWNPWARIPVYGRSSAKDIKAYLSGRDKAKAAFAKKCQAAEAKYLESLR